jgi:hypothetical protein
LVCLSKIYEHFLDFRSRISINIFAWIKLNSLTILIHMIVLSSFQAIHCDLLLKYEEGVKARNDKDVGCEE